MENIQSLSDKEFKQMVNLLMRFAENEMDQWEMWRFHSEKLGCPICVMVTIGPIPDCDISSYDDLSRFID